MTCTHEIKHGAVVTVITTTGHCQLCELDRLTQLSVAVSRWRRAKCPTPHGSATYACDGENHIQGCPVLVLWQDVIAAHNKLDPNLEHGKEP